MGDDDKLLFGHFGEIRFRCDVVLLQHVPLQFLGAQHVDGLEMSRHDLVAERELAGEGLDEPVG